MFFNIILSNMTEWKLICKMDVVSFKNKIYTFFSKVNLVFLIYEIRAYLVNLIWHFKIFLHVYIVFYKRNIFPLFKFLLNSLHFFYSWTKSHSPLSLVLAFSSPPPQNPAPSTNTAEPSPSTTTAEPSPIVE